MRTQNKPFVVEIKKAKRAIDAPAESPAPRGAAASPSIWNSMPEPSQPPLTASAARRAADALFDFKPKTAQPATPVERETPVVEATPIAAALPASPSTPSPTGRVLWVERPEPAVAAVDESSDVVPARRGRGRPRKDSAPSETEAPAAKRPRVAKPGARPVGRPRRVVAPVVVEPVPIAAQASVQAVLPQTAPLQAVPVQRAVRRIRTPELPRGERWKNRLPKFCR